MTTTIETNRLSGVDRGKHVRGISSLGKYVTGPLTGVAHATGPLVFLYVGDHPGVPFRPTDTIQITGTESPK